MCGIGASRPGRARRADRRRGAFVAWCVAVPAIWNLTEKALQQGSSLLKSTPGAVEPDNPAHQPAASRADFSALEVLFQKFLGGFPEARRGAVDWEGRDELNQVASRK